MVNDMQTGRNWKELVKKAVLIFGASAIISVGTVLFIMGRLWEIENIKVNVTNLVTLRLWTFFNRVYLFFLLFGFVGIHFFVPIKKMYNWMFDKRWLLGIALLLFLTVNRYHGDSIGTYNLVVQPGSVSEQSEPIFGETRTIRSDEYVVTTPAILASASGDNPYGKYNNVMRGEDTLNITNGIYLGYATLGYAPQELVYAVLPVEYAFSFCWWFPLIFGFLMSIELFYIVTNKKRLLSVTGAFLIIFSSFYLWWGFSSYHISAPGTIVCIYYFLHSKEYWKKILLGAGTALCFSMFVTNLYPAWQVPLGYMFLAIGIWILHENWDKIRQLNKKDYLILCSALLFMASMIFAYLSSISEYVETITQTAYPGERVDSGGFYIQKLFYYSQAPFYAYQELQNPCEAGVYFSLFPIPTIVAAYCWVREKKKDWLTGGLLLAQIPMLIYVTVGFSESTARLLLFSNSTVARMCDVIGLLQVYLIVILLSRYEGAKKVPLIAAIPLSVVTAVMSLYFSNQTYPDYLATYQKVIMLVVITLLCMGIMIELKDKMKNVLLWSFIAISIFTGVAIRPLMKGLDAIYSKPVAKEIQKICEDDPDAKWMTEGLEFYLSGYSVACGASTINSVNTYPNLKLWEMLDPSSQYADVYNRYAHVSVEFTEEDTSFEIVYPDYIELNLSYKDIEKIEAEYLLVQGELDVNEENSYVKFEKIYAEDNISIYHMVY